MATTPPENTADEPARREAEFDFAGRTITMLEPTSGQQLILITVLGLTDDGADTREKVNIVLNFATMLRSLIVEDADEEAGRAGGQTFVMGALARGAADLEDFVGLARQMAEHWDVGEDEATNRADRRARERRPAVAVRGGRGAGR